MSSNHLHSPPTAPSGGIKRKTMEDLSDSIEASSALPQLQNDNANYYLSSDTSQLTGLIVESTLQTDLYPSQIPRQNNATPEIVVKEITNSIPTQAAEICASTHVVSAPITRQSARGSIPTRMSTRIKQLTLQTQAASVAAAATKITVQQQKTLSNDASKSHQTQDSSSKRNRSKNSSSIELSSTNTIITQPSTEQNINTAKGAQSQGQNDLNIPTSVIIKIPKIKIPPPVVVITPKQDHAAFAKAVNEINPDEFVPKIAKFQSFCNSLLSTMEDYLNSVISIGSPINEKQRAKLLRQIHYLLFRFITNPPSHSWSSLYAPTRVSQLMDETNGQLIQLWLRKHYKSIKEKQKTVSIFGYIDTEDDYSEYFDYSERDDPSMNEEYKSLLNSAVCKNWKNKTNILVLNGQLGSAKTTALRCAIKSLNMQMVEINNGMKRGGNDLKKITEITQSCRIQNGLSSSTNSSNNANSQSKQPQPTQKGSIGAFFQKQKPQPIFPSKPKPKRHRIGSSDSSDAESIQSQQTKDEISLDTKDQNKKIVFFPNFDIQLDPLFQNEVLKLADNSKVPFILSTSQYQLRVDQRSFIRIESESYKREVNTDTTTNDSIEFSKPSEHSVTLVLFIIFEIERAYRQFHSSECLYVAFPETKDANTQQLQTNSNQIEQQFLSSEEFNQFLAKFPENKPKPNHNSIYSIQTLVKLFQSDWNTLFSFVQSNSTAILSDNLIDKALCYLQDRRHTLANLSDIYSTSVIPKKDIKTQSNFTLDIENTYQMFLHDSVPQECDGTSNASQQMENENTIEELELCLQEAEHLQMLDVLSVKADLYQLKQSMVSDSVLSSSANVQQASSQDSHWNSEQVQFFQPRTTLYIQQMSRHYSLTQIYSDISHHLSSLPSFNHIKTASNTFQDDFTSTIHDVKQKVFREQFRQHYGEKVVLRRSQINENFYIIPILDSIRTILGQTGTTKRTRTRKETTSPTILVTLVEAQVTPKTYSAYKTIQNHFKSNLLDKKSTQVTQDELLQEQCNGQIEEEEEPRPIDEQDEDTLAVVQSCNN